MRNYEVLTTPEFNHWLNGLQSKGRTIVKARLDMISIGIVMLHGGNKNAQQRDIKKAKKIRDEILEGSRPVCK